MRILVIEDNEVEIRLLEALFSATTSVQICIARNLAQAEQLVSTANFVVLDLGLPDVTQEQAIEWMSTCGLPTIVFSASWTPDIIQLAAEAHAVDFLVKGTISDQLMASIHFALAREDLAFECREQRIEACEKLAKRLQDRLKGTLSIRENNAYKT